MPLMFTSQNISRRPILITKSTVFSYVSIALDYVVCPRLKVQNLGQPEKKWSGTNTSCILIKQVRESAMKTKESKMPLSTRSNLENEWTKIIARKITTTTRH